MIHKKITAGLLSHPKIIQLRSLARRVRPIYAIMRVVNGTKTYEDRFKPAILQSLRKGDHVWDVGANVGFYTELFIESVGPTGHVTAFEPSHSCYSTLTERFKPLGEDLLTIENMALGGRNGEAKFAQDSADPLAPTNRVVEDGESKLTSTKVVMKTADTYLESGQNPPNVIKIDVEGAELEVIKGMQRLLKAPELRAIFLEIHFQVLQERGEQMAPNAIAHLLIQQGFAVEWIDVSHVRATR